MKTITALLTTLVITTLASPLHALPAFPGAEGCGSNTPGGRGGRVIPVTTLADSGPGSLRAAVTAPGPRIVVFRVGGTIRLKSHLRITEPFITIAGETATGDGILLRDAGLYVQTHDVVIRFVRSRVGPSLVEEFDTQDAIQISGDEPYNVVIDHCSFSWSIDECVGIRGPGHDITFSWNIVSEALREPFTEEQIGKERSHSMAMILGGKPTRCSVHHNLLADCNSRMPRIQGGRHDFVNNVVYDWGFLSGTFSREPEVNFIGNYYKRGPASRPIKAIVEKPAEMGRIYVKDNISHERSSHIQPEWEPIVNASAAAHQASEPFELAPLTIQPARDAYHDVLKHAGAILPKRDSVDTRIVRQTRLEMGTRIDRPNEVGGYPDMRGGAAPADADDDGMPDDWERAQGFDPHDPSDGSGDADFDGYTNVEEYFHEIVRIGMIPRPAFRHMTYGEETGPFQVECGEEDVDFPVLPIGTGERFSYTHAWFEGQVDLHVTWPGRDNVTGMRFLPWRYHTYGLPTGSREMTVRVNEEGPRLITIGTPEQNKPAAADPVNLRSLEVPQSDPRIAPFQDAQASNLILLMMPFPKVPYDAPEPEVIDAKDYGVMWGGSDITSKLQTALDDCGRLPSGGVVFVATGEHRVGTLRIPSNVILHLARSCRLYSNGLTDEGAIILFDGVENAGLAGPGVVDGRGHEGTKRAATVKVRNAKNIEIRDIVLRNPSHHGIEIIDSAQVRIDRSAVLSDAERENTGGLHIDGGNDITCLRSMIMGNSAGVSVVTTRPAATVDRVTVGECVIWTEGLGVMVGPDTKGLIRNLLFRDTDIVHCSNGISLSQRHDGGVEQVVFRDMTVNVARPDRPGNGGRPMMVANLSRRAAAMRDILFERVRTRAYGPVGVQGFGSALVEDVKFWGVRIEAESIPPAPDPALLPSLFQFERCIGPQLRFVYVRWPEDRESCWNKRLADFTDADEIKADPAEIIELGPYEPEP